VVPRETEDHAYAKFWGANKVYCGGCGNGEYTEFVMANRSGKPRYESVKTRRVRIESLLFFNMAVSVAKTSPVPVLLKTISP